MKNDDYEEMTDSDLVDLFDRAIEVYAGDSGVLSSAIGAAVVGRRVGWKILYLLHSAATVKKYEKVLGVSFRKFCPPEGDLASKSIGYRAVTCAKDFWLVVTGNAPGKSNLLEKIDLFAGFNNP